MNQLLGLADALVSDYSSTAIDYLILNRPIAFLMQDEDEYRDKRGYIFDDIEAALPGVIVKDVEGLLKFISQTATGADEAREKREQLRNAYHRKSDCSSGRRVLEVLGII